MDINILVYFIVLLGVALGFLFTAINRLRKINDETFIKKTEYFLRVSKNDVFDSKEYKKLYVIMNFSVFFILITAFIASVIVLKDSIDNPTTKHLELVTLLSNFLAVVLLIRINTMDFIKEKFVDRFDNISKTHYKFGYLLMNAVFLVALVYNLIMYI